MGVKEKKVDREKKLEYLGVSLQYNILYKIYSNANKTHYHKQAKTYYGAKLKTNETNKEHQDNITLEPIEGEEKEELLRHRVECPLCKKVTQVRKSKTDGYIRDNKKDFEVRNVVVKARQHPDSNTLYRFYCKNHPQKSHNRYEFRYDIAEIKMTVKELLEKLGLKKYYQRFPKRNEQNMIKFLHDIGIPTTLIEQLSNKSKYLVRKILRQNDDHIQYEETIAMRIVVVEKKANYLDNIVIIKIDGSDSIDDIEMQVKERLKKLHSSKLSSPHTD